MGARARAMRLLDDPRSAIHATHDPGRSTCSVLAAWSCRSEDIGSNGSRPPEAVRFDIWPAQDVSSTAARRDRRRSIFLPPPLRRSAPTALLVGKDWDQRRSSWLPSEPAQARAVSTKGQDARDGFSGGHLFWETRERSHVWEVCVVSWLVNGN